MGAGVGAGVGRGVGAGVGRGVGAGVGFEHRPSIKGTQVVVVGPQLPPPPQTSFNVWQTPLQICRSIEGASYREVAGFQE